MPQPISIRPARKSDREWCARLMASSEPWTTLKRGLRESRAALRRPGTQLLWRAQAGAGWVLFWLTPTVSRGLPISLWLPSRRAKAAGRRRDEFWQQFRRDDLTHHDSLACLAARVGGRLSQLLPCLRC